MVWNKFQFILLLISIVYVHSLKIVLNDNKDTRNIPFSFDSKIDISITSRNSVVDS